MPESIESVLRKTPIFASLTEKEMSALAVRVAKRRFQRGELLFGEGDACAGLFLVASGKIRIFKLSPWPRAGACHRRVQAVRSRNCPFLTGGTTRLRHRHWKTRRQLFISRKDFQNFCREHPDVALKVIAVVGFAPSPASSGSSKTSHSQPCGSG